LESGQHPREEHNPSARLPYSSRTAERRDRAAQDEPDGSELPLPSVAAIHHRESFPDGYQTLDDLPQIPAEEQTPAHQDHHRCLSGTCASDALDDERLQPFQAASLDHRWHFPERLDHPGSQGVGAGRWAYEDRPGEGAALDT
jgi:hypothetical protein